MGRWHDAAGADRQKRCIPGLHARGAGRRSLAQVIEIVEKSNLTAAEQKQAAKLRRLLNEP
jgi:hypothetical protein